MARPRKVQLWPTFGPPSPMLLRYAARIATHADLPVLDAGCGSGRNAVALAQRGLRVIGVDRDRHRLAQLAQQAPPYLLTHAAPSSGRVVPVQAELRSERWLFRDACFGAIIAVHFLALELLPHFGRSLIEGGHLFIETFGAQGGNYLDLPKAGQLRSILESDFDLPFYLEKPAGPPSRRAVTVKLLGRRK